MLQMFRKRTTAQGPVLLLVSRDASTVDSLEFYLNQQKFPPFQVVHVQPDAVLRHLTVGMKKAETTPSPMMKVVEKEEAKKVAAEQASRAGVRAQQSEQDVFGTHVVVVEAIGLLARQGQDLLGAGGEIVHCFFTHNSINRTCSELLFLSSFARLWRNDFLRFRPAHVLEPVSEHIRAQ